MATNRCDRVIIVSGDDSTGDTLMPWIGAGFEQQEHMQWVMMWKSCTAIRCSTSVDAIGYGGAAFVLERYMILEKRRDSLCRSIRC